MKIYSALRTSTFLLALVTIVAVSPSQAAENDSLRRGMKQVAEKVKAFLDSESRPLKVQLGEFEGFGLLQASGGIEITRVLAGEMQAVGITVEDGAPHLVEGANNRKIEVTGEPIKTIQGFRVKPTRFGDEPFESLTMEINTVVFDEFGEELAILPVQVFGSTALQISGIDADIPPSVSERERQRQVIEQVSTPKTTVKSAGGNSESIVAPSEQSEFGIEVLVKNGNSLDPRKVRLEGRKRAFIDLRRGEEYVVRLHNNADFEVAVSLTVDGVNVFQLANEPNLRASSIIIAPNSAAIVPGWFRSLENSNQFKIGAYQESVANEQQASLADVGTITAVFRASFGEGIPKPADEPTAGANSKDATPPAEATVLGPEIKKTYRQIRRDFGVVRAVVSIRYET